MHFRPTLDFLGLDDIPGPSNDHTRLILPRLKIIQSPIRNKLHLLRVLASIRLILIQVLFRDEQLVSPVLADPCWVRDWFLLASQVMG
jgi:hypothetical protein